jgi:hypothetical protein
VWPRQGPVKSDSASDSPYSADVFFWAVVSDEVNQVIEFFLERRQAETMLAQVLEDEPDWRGVLRVEKIEFGTGTAN